MAIAQAHGPKEHRRAEFGFLGARHIIDRDTAELQWLQNAAVFGDFKAPSGTALCNGGLTTSHGDARELGFMHKIENMYKTEPHAARALPLVDQAFLRLRQDVLSGTYGAGVKLKLDELQTAYGFSSSPLREALSRLAQEGLIRADERRGFRVADISPEDLADISRMRVMLDIPALRESIANGDDAWEALVVAAFHRLEKVEGRIGDGPVVLDDDWSRVHTAFHAALLAACPSERMRAWSASLFDQAERYRRYSARFRKTARRKSNEHRKIMDATLRRDAQTACALLEEHILSTQRNVMTVLGTSADRPGRS